MESVVLIVDFHCSIFKNVNGNIEHFKWFHTRLTVHCAMHTPLPLIQKVNVADHVVQRALVRSLLQKGQ